jgi:hypothetical protein
MNEMKRIAMLACVSMVLTAANAHAGPDGANESNAGQPPAAAAPSAPRGSFTVNALTPLVGLILIQYERPARNNASGVIWGGVMMPYLLFEDLDWGVAGGGGYRKYLGSRVFKGAFVEGLGVFNFADAGRDSGVAFQVDGLLGYKWIARRGFTTEVVGGMVAGAGTVGSYEFAGVSPTFGVMLGGSW